MAMNSAIGRNNTDRVHSSRKWRDRDSIPERTRLWTTQTSTSTHDKFKNDVVGAAYDNKVPVVYYLCRNGQLEHPHFMEVTLSNPDALYLKDVINRLNALRGKGMASLYSWSSKRSYKNGFVWQDLSENDLIYPSHGHDYVLKGSEILDFFPLKELSSEKTSKVEVTHRRNQSWSSNDMNEYKVYKSDSSSESVRRFAADASTQTDDKRRRRQVVKKEEIEEENNNNNNGEEIIEISPPPSDSSPETLESLIKADGRLALNTVNEESASDRTVDSVGKLKASTVLMQLISCGSISFRDCGATSVVKEQGLSLIGQFKGRLPRGSGRAHQRVISRENSGVRLEDKEYFSGSLIETKKEEVFALKRSNSYNSVRSTEFELAEREIEGVRTNCIPRKSKAGSKRIDESPIVEN